MVGQLRDSTGSFPTNQRILIISVCSFPWSDSQLTKQSVIKLQRLISWCTGVRIPYVHGQERVQFYLLAAGFCFLDLVLLVESDFGPSVYQTAVETCYCVSGSRFPSISGDGTQEVWNTSDISSIGSTQETTGRRRYCRFQLCEKSKVLLLSDSDLWVTSLET